MEVAVGAEDHRDWLASDEGVALARAVDEARARRFAAHPWGGATIIPLGFVLLGWQAWTTRRATVSGL